MIAEILVAFGTLFPIVNPISAAFVFDGLTAHEAKKRKYRLAYTAAIAFAVTLLIFLVLGQALMHFFSVTIYAFRVAGGLYLGKIAFSMLSKDFYKGMEKPSNDVAIIPVAIPLLAGPGSMAATLVLAQSASLSSYVFIGVAIVLVAIVSWLFLRFSSVLSNVLGENGANIAERILGLIVLVIAAQFIFNGVTGYLASIGVGV